MYMCLRGIIRESVLCKVLDLIFTIGLTHGQTFIKVA